MRTYPREEIPRYNDHVAWRQQLFQDYAARMLERERKSDEATPYAPERTASSLAWVARQMRIHGLAEWYLQQLQPDWLPTRRAPLVCHHCRTGRRTGCLAQFRQATADPGPPVVLAWTDRGTAARIGCQTRRRVILRTVRRDRPSDWSTGCILAYYRAEGSATPPATADVGGGKEG
jgi:hypothetical protein